MFVDDSGPAIGPVVSGATGAFVLRVPPGATGRIECTPAGMTRLVLTRRVVAGTGDRSVGDVDPGSSVVAVLLELEIGAGELEPADAEERGAELESEDDVSTIAAALDVVVEALVGAGVDAALSDVLLDLYDNGRLDDAGFATIAAAVNDALEAEDLAEDVVVAIDALHDELFAERAILTAARILIEHNATDEDTGFQGFVDGDPRNRLDVEGPAGARIVTMHALGGLRGFGLTETFFETSEPPNATVPIPTVLARLGEGNSVWSSAMVGGTTATRRAGLAHDIPAGPELLTPIDGSTGLSPIDLTISWSPVVEDIDGDPIEIVAYQVIVEEDAPPQFPQGFARPVLSVHLPASATRLSVPNGFLAANGCYDFEVLAIEASGNQTLSSASFETGTGCGAPTAALRGTPEMSAARILIEHNATDEDTGFQGFGDGDPWNTLTITGPGAVDVVRVEAHGGLHDFGLTELFFETSEPPNATVPIQTVLARMPPGTYTFTGDMVGGGSGVLTAELTHTIPAGPVLVSPVAGATDVDPADTLVSWRPVTTDLFGGTDLVIVGYQVIVELDAPPAHPQGFTKRVFSIFLPASATEVRVPAEFMLAGEDYEYEVLAIEQSGNQTLASAAFSTR